MSLRGKKKFRHYQNPMLRKTYMLENPIDEVLHLFPKSRQYSFLPQKAFSTQIPTICPARDPHHIMGGLASRYDIVTNLIAVSRVTHDWVGHTYPRDGLILCLFAKLEKEELDIEAIGRIVYDPTRTRDRQWRRDRMLHHIRRLDPVHDFVLQYHRQLITSIEDGTDAKKERRIPDKDSVPSPGTEP